MHKLFSRNKYVNIRAQARATKKGGDTPRESSAANLHQVCQRHKRQCQYVMHVIIRRQDEKVTFFLLSMSCAHVVSGLVQPRQSRMCGQIAWGYNEYGITYQGQIVSKVKEI